MGTARILCLAGCALAGQLAQAEPISGAAAVDLVRDAMRVAGVSVPEMAVPLRALPDCAHAPRVTPHGGSWATAELACDAPIPWVRLLRTGSAAAVAPPATGNPPARSSAPTAATTVVALRPLPRGTRISAQDLASGTAAGLAPALRLDDPALAIGRRLRVALRPGQPVLERHLEPALDVEADQPVTVLLTVSGIEIISTATARSGGTVGDRIALRKPDGGSDFEAVIIAPGIVRVRPNMPRRTAVTHRKWRLSWSIRSLRTTSRGFVLRATSIRQIPAALPPRHRTTAARERRAQMT
ncbi:flagellar basal body P-ring formation chaperone FlgA [Pseudotabrizicola algicola]|uniref:Flagellar basal body P-ring formation protein FlgA n=1 Tax=Pseudotabrizicola algicola TaxID=2709381 RepID=A0A6B3RJG6_9RHOB|nr:flagellar basal body P-ring formation chaperone FlgA [Pseudotabrizicola algicola]NEX45263.1 flagellar basal body P-ring formation protein FlgA [Pseudotabrizicola algicola]